MDETKPRQNWAIDRDGFTSWKAEFYYQLAYSVQNDLQLDFELYRVAWIILTS